MSRIDIEFLERHLQFALSTKQGRDEIMLTYYRAGNDFSWFDKATTVKQMKVWRQQAKQNICKISESFEVEKFGKTFYCFVVQFTDEDFNSLCRLGVALGIFVDGFVYSFFKKENRDATMSYVMKNI
jgi:hypothetical protein